MSSFSPYLHPFETFQTSQDDDLDSYYNRYTLLSKPTERNTYKVSLAQMLNYLIDFGIGYNSVCSVELRKMQQFSSAMYVNRHKTEKIERPATVADLKTIVENVVRSLVNHTVFHNTEEEPEGMKVTNTVYPTYLLTLDEKVTTAKLKELTNMDYIEVEDFVDFPCTDGKDFSMQKYPNGYAPMDSMLICPKHGHTADDSMKNSWKYEWHVKISAEGKLIIWSNHGKEIGAILQSGHTDATVGPINAITWQKWQEKFIDESKNVTASYSCSPSWDYPNGVTCHENPVKPPTNLVDGEVSIRWPGRRYRLFKLAGS